MIRLGLSVWLLVLTYLVTSIHSMFMSHVNEIGNLSANPSRCNFLLLLASIYLVYYIHHYGVRANVFMFYSWQYSCSIEVNTYFVAFVWHCFLLLHQTHHHFYHPYSSSLVSSLHLSLLLFPSTWDGSVFQHWYVIQYYDVHFFSTTRIVCHSSND